MNFKEALIALVNGKKIRHVNAIHYGYIRLDNDNDGIIDENGDYCTIEGGEFELVQDRNEVSPSFILFYQKHFNHYCVTRKDDKVPGYFNPRTGNWDKEAGDCWMASLPSLMKIVQAKLGFINFEYRQI